MAKETPEEEPRSLTRWDPFGDLGLFEGWPSLRGRGGLVPRLRLLAEEQMPVPAIEVHESDDRYTITAEIPGIPKDDIQVECHEGTLTIRGEKRNQRDEEKEKQRWTERVYGSFSRSFRLPGDADEDKIEASFRDGVLTVEIARSGERKPRSVEIRG